MTSTTPTEPEALAAATFLLDRLDEFERELEDGVAFREYNGHVAPAAARLRSTLSTPAARMIAGEGEAVDDVMIGNFIAQYDEGAAGCMMEADDAQALAHEFKRMQGLIYCPGVLRCAKCDFRLIKTTLTPAGAFANEEPDSCPNCNVPMWRVTWKDEAHDAYKTAESQMNRALEAERKLAHPLVAECVGIEPHDEADYAELHRLQNFTDDDSVQFTRWNMLTAIHHGRRLANEATAHPPAADPVGLREAILCAPFDPNEDYDEVRRDERERIIRRIEKDEAQWSTIPNGTDLAAMNRAKQAIGAAISNGSIQSVERAYNTLRDLIDRALSTPAAELPKGRRVRAPRDMTGASARTVLVDREIVDDVQNGCLRLGDGKTVGGIVYRAVNPD